MAKRRPAPLYPPPSAVELKSPLKVTAPGELQCSDPEDAASLQALSQEERDRFRLFDRLRGYKVVLLQRLSPVVDLTGEHSWEAVVAKLPTIILSDDVPGEVRDALLALKVLATMNVALTAMKEIPQAAQVAICAAIDFGQLLQRGQAELDFASTVHVGAANDAARSKAKASRKTKKLTKREQFRREYQRRRDESPLAKETDIINTIAALHDFGNVRTLYRYKKELETDTTVK